MFETEPFNGNNPIFIPFISVEQDYQDKFINNQDQILDKSKKPEDEKVLKDQVKNVKNTLNFIKNLGLDEMPAQFGSFQSNKEFDNLYTKMELAGLS